MTWPAVVGFLVLVDGLSPRRNFVGPRREFADELLRLFVCREGVARAVGEDADITRVTPNVTISSSVKIEDSSIPGIVSIE